MKQLLTFYVMLFLLGSLSPANAQGVIRDSEIETYIRTMSTPIFTQAGLNADDVSIILLSNPSLNAFVAGGQNIFLHTGLILETEDVGELIGVIAHETAHIAAGHLIRSQEVGRKSGTQAIITTILGAAIGLGGGGGEAAGAIIAGGQASAISRQLKNSRTYEASADQAAIAYLNDAGYSGRGMTAFLQKLAGQELLPPSQQADYLRTHPLTRDRVESVAAAVEQTRNKDQQWPSVFKEYHARIKAKIYGYMMPDRIKLEYEGRNDFVAKYARAIADYRHGKIDKAIEQIDVLLGKETDNGYLHELKGQILLENSRIDEAITAYRRAVEILPDQILIRLELAKALLERRDNGLLGEAIKNLILAEKKETATPRLYRLFATAYGRSGNDGLAKLYLAEEALLKGDISFAISQARLAQGILDNTSGSWQRAQDIIDQSKNQQE